ncbi:MAG: Asp23/Gls24 family envelope stress response protein [Candidatus Hinthialibacter sp.]
MVGFFENDLGRVQISPSIIRRIIMREVEGNRYFRFLGQKIGEPVSRKTAERCIKVYFVEGAIEATLTLTVLYGTRIIKEARILQGKMAKALELTAGLHVNKMAINVENVFLEEEQQPLLIEHNSVHINAVNQ